MNLEVDFESVGDRQFLVAGADPGLKGGLILLDARANVVERLRFKDIVIDINSNTKRKRQSILDVTKLSQLLIKCSHIYVEQVSSGSGQGVASMFSFGIGFGQLLSACQLSGVPYTLVRPSVWQKVIFNEGLIDEYCQEPKKRSRLAALCQWDKSIFMYKGCRVPDEGLMDAALIGLWGLRSMGIESLEEDLSYI